MSTKPRKETKELTADDWVSQGAIRTNGHAKPKEETTRFTIDIPVSLHARIKSQCALKRVKMREEVLAMLEEKFSVK